MSYTTLYAIDKNGDIFSYKEYRNAHMGAMNVWILMQIKYKLQKSYSSFEEVWKLWKNEKVSMSDRITIASTFDNVYVKKENFQRLAEAFSDWSKSAKKIIYRDDYSGDIVGGQAGHIEEQALDIRELANEDVVGVCWSQTSCGTYQWEYARDENDDPVPFNFFKDGSDLFWELFEEFDDA